MFLPSTNTCTNILRVLCCTVCTQQPLHIGAHSGTLNTCRLFLVLCFPDLPDVTSSSQGDRGDPGEHGGKGLKGEAGVPGVAGLRVSHGASTALLHPHISDPGPGH